MPRNLRAAPPVIYEIFPRAFLDTTGNGIGDLRGVATKLDYIADLGVDAIWLAPFYPSPLVDAGYDVADHRAVHPDLGTLADFDALVAAADARGLGVLVDLVLNHTSTLDPRFQAALAGDDAAAAHYVFRDPKPDGSPPNNWMSFFGGPAWYWSHERSQYYLHQFTSHQPSLDLRNDAVQADIERTVRFWRDRGVSGFRLDVVTAYLFDPSLADNPPASPEARAKIEGPAASPYAYQDHIHDMLPGDGAAWTERLRAWAGEDLWLVGECNTGNQSLEVAKAFCAPGRLDAMYTTDMPASAHRPEAFAPIFEAMEGQDWILPWWFSSHDQPRPASRMPDVPPPQMARFLATILCAMPGPLLLYQGEELGLPQPDLPKDAIDDPFELRFWPDGPGRPGPRVPLPWTDTPGTYGFTTGQPTLPMNWSPDLAVSHQAADPHSVLGYYRRMLSLRRAKGFATGQSHQVEQAGEVLSVTFQSGGQRYRAVMNFGPLCEVPPQGAPLLETNPGERTLPKMGARIEHL
ncbi:alpha-glucosidase [Jannaschia pagri]|uniref:Alpha-glucosidase n=1 Tax=Jannaschia pagri TaxID=2829797 RepID=A0ABQ4NRW4_9RHOB|nr:MULTISPECIES: alpha-amylase family glycosyl hydrolase [unclassified Jannaschia]GIT93213.1 alpha-glucosidase [Jannaschia sp. AI_61]GIT97020.1 alpha-glucosidase [Jannaschia sp. AI_62]